MCSVEYLREFVTERLTAAAEEIIGVFVKTMVQNEAEISERRLRDVTVKFPKIKLHRIDLTQQVCNKDEVLIDKQLCNHEEKSSVDKEEPEPLQIKEEQEHCFSHEAEPLVLKQETDTVMVTSANKKSDLSEPEPNLDQLFAHSSPVAEVKGQEGSTQVDLGSTNNAELKPMNRCHGNQSCSADNFPVSEGRCNIDSDLLQHFICKEEVLEDILLFNQEANSSLGQGDPGFPPIKEEWEELCISQEREQLVLDQTTNPLTVASVFEKISQCQPKPNSHQLLTHNSLYHNRNYSDVKFYSCNICGKSFKYASRLKMHVSIHTDEKPFSCEACGKNFRRRDHLLIHMRTHTGEKPYPCKICGKAFRDSSNLIYHIRFHTGEKRHSCEICGKRFYHKANLNSHMATHTGIKPYQCSICGKRFACSGNLKTHGRTHTGEKPYSCNTCGKNFSQSTALRFHKKIHTGERPFSCKICEKSFIQSRDLTVHLRSHTGEKPYTCKTCGKSFSQKSHLTVHMRTHTGVRPYTCKICGKTFSQNSHLTVHMGSHKSEKSCKTFGGSFAQSIHKRTLAAVRQHLCRSHKALSSTSALTEPTRIHAGEGSNACETSEKL